MTQVSFNLVLPLGVRSADVISKIDAACREINEMLDLEFRHARQEKTGPGVTTEIWEDRHAGTISLVDDTNVPAVYVAPFLRISYGNETTFDALAQHVPSVPVAELRDLAERGEPTRTAALIRLGLGETEDNDVRTARLLGEALTRKSIEERRAAALAIFLLKWSAFRRPLDEAIPVEPDADLRQQLKIARQYLGSNRIL